MTQHNCELVQLNTDAKALYADIQYFVTPLSEVHTLLADVQTLLKKPQDFNKKLGEIYKVLDGLEGACKAGSWIPEVGSAAKGAGEFLAGINGFIKSTRGILKDIERDIKPLQDWIKDLQEPIDDAWGAVGPVEGRLEALANVTAQLRKHYHDKPPKGVESCAATLNKPLHPVTGVMNDAKDEANAGLNAVEQPLRAAWNALGRLLDYTDFIDKIYKTLDPLRKLINTISGAIKKAADYGKAAIEYAISKIGKAIAKDTYKKVKKMLKAVDDEISKLRKKLTDFLFKPVQDMVRRVENDIKDKLGNLPAVKKLETAVGQIKSALSTVLHAIENQADPCKNIFNGSVSAGG